MIGIYGFYYNGKCLYIGSSKDVKNRFIHHKSSCYNKNDKDYNTLFYKYIRENNINFKDLKFMIYRTFKIYDKFILEKSERSYIEWLKPNSNKYIPTRTQKESSKEYYENNKDYYIEYNKEYYENNKYNINEKSVCEYCFKNITKSALKRHQKSHLCSLDLDILFS